MSSLKTPRNLEGGSESEPLFYRRAVGLDLELLVFGEALARVLLVRLGSDLDLLRVLFEGT